MRSLEKQDVVRKVTVIKDMIWVDALNQCATLSKSRYYLRVDDDMFLHPRAVGYYVRRLGKIKRAGVYECKLWEDWTNKPAGSLKAYNTKVAKSIGFRPSKLGKVDKVFSRDLQKTKYNRVKDKSMIGLHTLASAADQKKYRALWRDKNAKISAEEFAKTFDNLIHHTDMTLDEQYEVLGRIPKINRKYKTFFHEYLK